MGNALGLAENYATVRCGADFRLRALDRGAAVEPYSPALVDALLNLQACTPAAADLEQHDLGLFAARVATDAENATRLGRARRGALESSDAYATRLLRRYVKGGALYK